MTAVNSAQTPSTDLLLSLLTGMVGGPAMDQNSAASGKSGEFAGLLDALEAEPLASKELSDLEWQTDSAKEYGDSQLNSLMTAALTSPTSFGTLPNQASGYREVEVLGLDSARQSLLVHGVTPTDHGVTPTDQPTPHRQPTPELVERPAAGWAGSASPAGSLVNPNLSSETQGNPTNVSANGSADGSAKSSQTFAAAGGPANPAITGERPRERADSKTTPDVGEAAARSVSDSIAQVDQEAPGLPGSEAQSAPSFDQMNPALTALNPEAASQAGAEVLTSGQPRNAPGERGTRGTTAREFRSAISEGSWQWGGDPSSADQTQTAAAVTAISAGTPSRQDSIQASLSEDVESTDFEPLHRRPEQATSAHISPTLSEPAELVELQTEFDSHLEELAEAFPLGNVAAQIATAVEPDAGWITVEIQPPELGKLEIMVSKQGDDYLARIVAHEAATGDALNLQREQLIEALGQHGLELKEVQISSESNSGSSWSQTETQQESNQGRDRQGFGEERSPSDSNPRRNPEAIQTPVLFAGTEGEGRKQVNLLV